eukprot:350915-Chlamydomonas_euryale.AAC.2
MWKAPDERGFVLSAAEIGELCDAAERLFQEEPTVLDLQGVGVWKPELGKEGSPTPRKPSSRRSRRCWTCKAWGCGDRKGGRKGALRLATRLPGRADGAGPSRCGVWGWGNRGQLRGRWLPHSTCKVWSGEVGGS